MFSFAGITVAYPCYGHFFLLEFGCAMIYSAFEKKSIEDITVSFVITPKPVKLFNHISNDRGFEVDEVSQGMYYVKGDAFSIQIIESKKLNAKENIF